MKVEVRFKYDLMYKINYRIMLWFFLLNFGFIFFEVIIIIEKDNDVFYF